jgi:tRNA-2-methylthio-N6-dimethylallyladenosine synthase
MRKSFYLKTFGCQMNEYDSDRMRDIINNLGYEDEKPYYDDVDLVILNTCHIREKAAEKLYSDLGRISAYKKKREDKGRDMIIAVCGCTAEADGEEIFKRNKDVDIVLGPQAYHNLAKAIEKIEDVRKNPKEKDGKRVRFKELVKTNKFISLECNTEEKFESFGIHKKFNPVSAFVTIQEGCNKFCTFCIVPFTRGKEYCRELHDVMHEVKVLASKGVREITFLGQNVDAYLDKNGNRLSTLIRETSKINEIARIRYVTSHPINITDDLILAHKECEKLMPILSLPVQSGSTAILKKMNRKYTREFYIDKVQKLREARPDLIMSSDFIVGFPNETDEDFEDTMNLVKEVKFNAQSFSFVYSPRSGTTASVMKDSVDAQTKKERLYRLQDLLEEQRTTFNNSFLGQTIEVLFDNKENRGGLQISGRTPFLQVCIVEAKNPQEKDELYGQIHNVKITKVTTNSMQGELV